MIYGDEEGATCNRNGCTGEMYFAPVENCSCHISPPCGRCVDNPLVCNKCGYAVDKEVVIEKVTSFLPDWMREN